MNDLNDLLDSIERDWNNDPYHVYEYLQEGDLLLAVTPRHRHVLGVRHYDHKTKRLFLNFIYTVKADNFREFERDDNENNWDYIEKVQGYPTARDIEAMSKNFEYIQYISTWT